MRTFAVGALTALVLFAATSAGALAANPAPGARGATPAGPYEGKFQGQIWNDNGTSAPLSVNLTHRGDTVAGTASLGEGIVVETRFCGAATIPAATRWLSGHTQAGSPKHLEATSTFTAEGIPFTVRFSSDASADGTTINGAATIDLPWFCGGDPVLTGVLHKSA